MAFVKYFWIFCFAFSSLSLVSQNMEFRSREEADLLTHLANHSNPRMRWTLIDSKIKDFSEELLPFEKDLHIFEKLHYDRLHPLLFEKNMLELQKLVAQGRLSYEDLTLYFLCRIWKYERDPATRLNALISLNPKVLDQARLCDQNREEGHSLLYGMPILLKDNINTVDMPTTAGAAVLQANETEDAFLVKRLKEAGALILGKANLSEWAYYFCEGCPVGYSAVGGQTLNPYGPMVYESGGSSSGSGAAIAARYAVAAVGTETSGSILSPSAQNALVGLKPTVGLISRSGVIPISTTLDTPGPMTLSLIDNMILFAAMMGRDPEDPKSLELEDFMVAMHNKIGKIRLGMPSRLLRDSSILAWAQSLNQGNLEIIALEEPSPSLDGFRSILDGEMPKALVHYFEKYAHATYQNWTLDTLISKNRAQQALLAPYGQQLFEHMAAHSLSDQEVEAIMQNLQKISQQYFSRQKETLKLDAFLSINNYHAALAAVAHAPCLTLPLGRRPNGEPFNLTLIGESKEEKRLFEIGWMLESMLAPRQYPHLYRK
jgi:amidase